MKGDRGGRQSVGPSWLMLWISDRRSRRNRMVGTRINGWLRWNGMVGMRIDGRSRRNGMVDTGVKGRSRRDRTVDTRVKGRSRRNRTVGTRVVRYRLLMGSGKMIERSVRYVMGGDIRCTMGRRDIRTVQGLVPSIMLSVRRENGLGISERHICRDIVWNRCIFEHQLSAISSSITQANYGRAELTFFWVFVTFLGTEERFSPGNERFAGTGRTGSTSVGFALVERVTRVEGGGGGAGVISSGAALGLAIGRLPALFLLIWRQRPKWGRRRGRKKGSIV